MEMVGMLLMAVGGIVMLVFGIMVLIKAFQTSVLWGLGSLFIPFVILIFVIKNWDDTKKPFLYYLGGLVLLIVGGVVGGMGGAASM